MKVRISNSTRGTVLADAAVVAATSAERRTGLLKRTGLSPGEGLWIVPCEGVHTFGMKFAIDIVFLNKRKVVRKVKRAVPRRRIVLDLLAHSVVELPAGAIEATQTAVGDQLELDKS